jgi:acetyltransferase EpsM
MATFRRDPTDGTNTPVNSGRAIEQRLVIIGGGGHGVVVAEAATLAGWKIDGFLDDSTEATAGELYPHLGPMKRDEWASVAVANGWFVLCVGDVGVRRRVLDGATPPLERWATIVHPAAFVSPTAVLGRGVFVGPGAVVHSGAIVGDHAIVNSGAIVEHHCLIGENTHVGPGAVLAGACRVGADSLIGVGARVLPRLTVGSRVTVGAGGVVVKVVGDGRTVKGVPAR